jgi:hypothetical protein
MSVWQLDPIGSILFIPGIVCLLLALKVSMQTLVARISETYVADRSCSGAEQLIHGTAGG